jgi:hypothetical protein
VPFKCSCFLVFLTFANDSFIYIYFSIIFSITVADHSCLVSSGGILDEDSCHGSHDMVCDDRFGNFMTDEPNFPP